MTATTNGHAPVSPGRAKKSAAKKVMPPMPPVPEPDPATDPFLLFWDEFEAGQRQATTTILGVTIVVPYDVPTYYDELQRRMAVSKDELDAEEALALYEEMLVLLFGEGTVDQWRATKLLTNRMLRVLTIWGMRNANSVKTSFAEAGRLVVEAEEAEAEGKPVAPNRATRRKPPVKASSTTRTSGTTGQRSRQTSRASTARKRAT